MSARPMSWSSADAEGWLAARSKPSSLASIIARIGGVEAVEVGLLAARVLAHHVQRHFRLVEKGHDHLIDQFAHLLEALLWAGRRGSC